MNFATLMAIMLSGKGPKANAVGGKQMSRLKMLAAGLFFAASALATSAADAKEMNLAFTLPTVSHYGAGAQAFADKIAELSKGDITINLKPAGVLGGEREVLEGLQIGTIELAISSTGPIGGFVPEIYALDFPFLFKDSASARRILDGPDRKSTRLNSSHSGESRMPSSA